MNRRLLSPFVAVGIALLFAGLNTVPGRAQAPQAQTVAVANVSAQSQADVLAYWTPERFASATPMPLPMVDAASYIPDGVQSRGVAQGSPAGEPNYKGPLNQVKLFDPAPPDPNAPNDVQSQGVQPQNYGTLHAHFTSSRVQLQANDNDRTYPYITVGRLFFSQGVGTSFSCSASVIAHRLIATAGHCVHDGHGKKNGTGGTWSTNVVFVPGYRSGGGPVGAWAGGYEVTTLTWFAGGGGVPNAADYAIIELADSRDGQPISNFTGWLGWQTLSLAKNQVTMIGYPGNFDNAELMHQVAAGNKMAGGHNTTLYGSDMSHGSSGGPWIQNFGEPSPEQTHGFNLGSNRVVAVTSYGWDDGGSRLAQGASIFDGRWVSVWTTACGHLAGNC